MPPEVTMTACGVECEVPDDLPRTRRPAGPVARREDVARDTRHGTVLHCKRCHAVPEPQLDPTAVDSRANPAQERFEHARTGTPGHVESRDRVAVRASARDRVPAAFRPLDDREPSHALGGQPGPLLTGGELDICLGPASRPVVLRPVEPGRAQPVGQGQLARVVHSQPPLLGGVDEHQPAERPERLAAERRGRLLVQQDDPATGVGQLGGGDETGQPGPHDQDIGVHALPTGRGAGGSHPVSLTILGPQSGRNPQGARNTGPALTLMAMIPYSVNRVAGSACLDRSRPRSSCTFLARRPSPGAATARHVHRRKGPCNVPLRDFGHPLLHDVHHRFTRSTRDRARPVRCHQRHRLRR